MSKNKIFINFSHKFFCEFEIYDFQFLKCCYELKYPLMYVKEIYEYLNNDIIDNIAVVDELKTL
jgi:hypothetical protein